MIAVMLKYTFDNVAVISEDIVGYVITYNGWPICVIYKDMEELLKLQDQDEEDIYQYVYDKTYREYQKKLKEI